MTHAHHEHHHELEAERRLVRRCSACGEEKPLDEFYERDRYRDGWVECKTCARARSIAANAARREAIGDEAWRAENAAATARARARPEARARAKAATRAYNAASARLRQAHRDEFEFYLADERRARGLPVDKWERT